MISCRRSVPIFPEPKESAVFNEFIILLVLFEIIGCALRWDARTTVVGPGRLPFMYTVNEWKLFRVLSMRSTILYSTGYTISTLSGGSLIFILFSIYLRHDFSILRLVLIIVTSMFISLFADFCGWLISRYRFQTVKWIVERTPFFSRWF